MTWLELAKRILRTDDDELADWALWEKTAYPLVSPLCVVRQLVQFRHEIEAFDG